MNDDNYNPANISLLPLGTLDMSYENVRQLAAKCDASKYMLLSGISFKQCTYEHGSVPGETCADSFDSAATPSSCPGMQVGSVKSP